MKYNLERFTPHMSFLDKTLRESKMDAAPAIDVASDAFTLLDGHISNRYTVELSRQGAGFVVRVDAVPVYRIESDGRLKLVAQKPEPVCACQSKRPLAKKRIVIEALINSHVLNITTSDDRAYCWIETIAPSFGRLRASSLDELDFVLFLNPCYDINEVKEYLEDIP